ncbi:hypothetical protein EMCRGX_G024757 [Ephydatia muelleri]|eukprot:Em0015g920a
MALSAPLNNGIGRYLCQLKRLTLQYCKNGGSSNGMREYIDTHVIKFALANPQVSVYVRHRPSRHPRIIGEFLNGNSKVIAVNKLKCKEVKEHVDLLRTSSGIKATKLKKWWHTDNPSIQGNWSPFLNK